MRLMDRLRALNPTNAPPNVLGTSMVVRFTPEPATGESLAIGVVIRTKDGCAHGRWLEQFDRARCAFGDQFLVHLPLLINEARRQVELGKAVRVPLLETTVETPVYGQDLEGILSALFTRFVPLAGPQPMHLRRLRMQGISNVKLQKNVFDLLRRDHATDAENIIAQNPELRFPAETIRTVLHVPLQGVGRCAGRFGTIVSAQARDPNRLRLNIHPAVAELNTAASLRKIQHRGLFILRPKEGAMPDEQYEKIDAELANLIKMFEAQKIAVSAELDEQSISDAVSEWSALANPAKRSHTNWSRAT